MKPLTSIALCLALQLLPAAAQGAPAPQDRAAPTATAAETDPHAVLLALERQRANAILRRDIPTLRTLMDRQYSHVESRGRARSKTELLTALDRGAFSFRVYENETTEIQLLGGGDAALVTGVFRSVQATPVVKHFRGRYARIWVRQPDGWKNTYHQATEIRPAQQEPCPCD